MKVPSSDKLAAWSNIAAGISTTAAAGLAFWAFFFTDIAAELTKQYNAQIAELNEQLVDLRREKRGVQDQAAEAQNEKQSAEQEIRVLKESSDEVRKQRDEMQTQVNSLSSQTDELQSELRNLKSEQAQIVADLSKARSALLKSGKDKEGLFIELVREQIGAYAAYGGVALKISYLDDAQAAADLRKYIDLSVALSKLGPQDLSSHESAVAWGKKYAELALAIPTSWNQWRDADDNRDAPAEFAELHTTDPVAAFRRHLSKADRRMTGEQFFADWVASRNFSGVLPPDLARLKAALSRFAAKHHDELTAPIVVVEPESASVDDVVSAGLSVVTNINRLNALLEGAAGEVIGMISK